MEKPQPVEVELCSVCSEPWKKHVELVEEKTYTMKFIETPTGQFPHGSVCPFHNRVHNSHGWYVCIVDDAFGEVTLDICVKLLKEKNRGPRGYTGAMGATGARGLSG